ncbi:MAG: iron-sulfur cluster-binding domain-containing protein [Hahellaceae bacterium]|nr:iron-sulfur cluster-binding domain-containing protein [Hahellaceae bacterium]
MQTQSNSTTYWNNAGPVQDTLDFILTSIDPLMSRQRLMARVINCIQETDDTLTYTLQVCSRWQGFKPGQFVTISAEINGITYKRNYSISSSPELLRNKRQITLTIRAQRGGKVSPNIGQWLKVDDTLEISAAMGDFICLEAEKQLYTEAQRAYSPVALIAAGSGITPIKAMLESFCENRPDHDICLIVHAANPAQLIFANDLKRFTQSLPNLKLSVHFSDKEGFVTQNQLLKDCPDLKDRVLYICGPAPFMAKINDFAEAAGVPDFRRHQEAFSSPVAPRKSAGPVTVTFTKTGKTVTSANAVSLLELAERSGLKPKFGCRNGICHECTCQRTQGSLVNALTGNPIPDEQTQVQSCISIPTSDVTITNW